MEVPYRQAIGSLMYLMIGTRPGISYAVGKLAQFCESPKLKHWTAVKRVLRYVSGSRTMGICFDGAAELRALGYCDADWAGDVKDRKSTSGYIFMMGGSALSWASRKQTVVSTSSCEAEYIAMSTACKEWMWLKRLVSVFTSHTGKSDKMKLFSDSQSGIKLSQNESINRRNKHIDITYHYVRDVVKKGEIELGYIPTGDMIADMLTKPLGKVKLVYLRRLSGLRTREEFQKQAIKGEC